jgi:hypothetical protein
MEKVNVKRLTTATDEENNQLIAIGTLRLMHDSLCIMLEKGVESVSPYSIEGFSNGMKVEPVSQEVNNALLAIAEEADVMQYISSPYAKLALIWMSCAATSLKRKTNIKNKKNVRFRNVESGHVDETRKLDSTMPRVQKVREKHGNLLSNGTLRI